MEVYDLGGGHNDNILSHHYYDVWTFVQHALLSILEKPTPGKIAR